MPFSRGVLFSSGALLIAIARLASAQVTDASAEIPRNLGGSLRELVALNRSRPAGSAQVALRGQAFIKDPATGKRRLTANPKRAMLVDRRNRVLVTIHLDGSSAIEEVRKSLADLGISIVAENPDYRSGSLSALLPLASAERLARTPGISTVLLVERPITHVGAVTSQGTTVVKSDQLNKSGLTGQGITVGILSDSYNGNVESPTAYDDVNTGDLPNVGVADGRPGVKFLQDGGDDFQDSILGDSFTDEGRALAQVVYDTAPGVSLCFATAALGPASMATNIRRLRRDSSCAADIMVDDIFQFSEPWFSDGQVAQAINDVVTGSTLAGKKVLYFTAAGNDAGAGYSATLQFVDNATARSTTGLPVDLTTIPSSMDTSGGFHNFNPVSGGTAAIVQKVTLSGVDPTLGVTVVMQWDDPFDLKNGVTTDLDLLVFDSKGKYLGALNDDNFSVEEPIEAGTFSNDGVYYFAIARRGPGTHLSTQVRYVFPGGGGLISGDYLTLSQPAIMEHAGAQNAISVAAYNYDNGLNSSVYTPELEPYSSPGPVTLAFDSSGKRLSTYQTLRKPDIAAPDCVSNTFLGSPDPDDVFFSFCGTSAAAPHAAGVAALLLQAAGGPGSLTQEQVRNKLQQSSTATRDLDPFFSQAALTSGAATVNISASGDYLDGTEDNPNFFTVTFNSSTSGQTLTAVSIDLTPTPQSLIFNPTTRTGYPFTVGTASSGVTVTSTAPTAKTKILNLTFGGFGSGSSISFGIEPDCSACVLASNLGLSALADTADMLAGATVTATLSDGTKLTGTFMNKMGTGWSSADGFGMIDAVAASKVP